MNPKLLSDTHTACMYGGQLWAGDVGGDVLSFSDLNHYFYTVVPSLVFMNFRTNSLLFLGN